MQIKKFSEFSGTTVEVVSESNTTKTIDESAVKFGALEVIRQAQTALAEISLLDVLSVMKPENPLRKDIIDMESKIHELTTIMGEFINNNIADAEMDTEEAPTEEPKKPEEKEDKKEDKKDPKKEVKKDPKKDDKKSAGGDKGTEEPKGKESPSKDEGTDSTDKGEEA